MHVRKPEVPALELECELFVVDAEAMQNRGLQVMHVHRVRHNVVRVVIGLAKCHASLDSATREPHRETAWVMIAAVVVFSQLALAVDCPAEFSTPTLPAVVEQSRLLQVISSRRSLICTFALHACREKIVMLPTAMV